MKCSECGKWISLPSHKRVEIDTLIKEYVCENGHKNIYKHYGNTIEINGKVSHANKLLDLSQADRSEARKRRNRDLLQTITDNKKN